MNLFLKRLYELRNNALERYFNTLLYEDLKEVYKLNEECYNFIRR